MLNVKDILQGYIFLNKNEDMIPVFSAPMV